MGNSPSRTELNGDHMPSIANNSSGHETYQSHSYPSKFSSVPGIHNEYGSSTLPSKSPGNNRHHHNNQREVDMDPLRHGGLSTQSVGFRTPDPMYSMDSLNVVGNNASSITSAELPPSSISPANCVTDPWRTAASSYSDESLHTQCRNLSRLHKDYHQHEEDEGLSSSTFEGDSLNPEATLSGMQNPGQFQTFTRSCNGKRETNPKPEVAEEAIEKDSTLKRAPPKHMGQLDTPFQISQSPKKPSEFGITINGRKVSTCEETPLPLIFANQKDLENGTGSRPCPSSKMGITSPELHNSPVGNNNTNTLKRGRMKSPPPPPPISKVGSSSSLTTSPPPPADPPEKRSLSSSLNSLFRRNVFSSSRKSSASVEGSHPDRGTHNGVALVKPTIQTPLYQQPKEKNESTSSSSSSPNEHDVFLIEPQTQQPYHPHKDKEAKAQQATEAEGEAARKKGSFEESFSSTSSSSPTSLISQLPPPLQPSVSSSTPNEPRGGGHCQEGEEEELQASSTANDNDPCHDNVCGGAPRVSEKLVGTIVGKGGSGGDNADTAIRPCELGKENSNFVHDSSSPPPSAPLSNEKVLRIEDLFGNSPPTNVKTNNATPDYADSMMAIPILPSTVTNTAVETVSGGGGGMIEGLHEIKKRTEEELLRKKTELDCKDGGLDHHEDHDQSSLSNSDQIKFLSCSSNGLEMGKCGDDNGNSGSSFDDGLIGGGKSKPSLSLSSQPQAMNGDEGEGGSVKGKNLVKNDNDGGIPPSKFGPELMIMRRGELSRESSPVKLVTTPPSSLVFPSSLLHNNDKSGKWSNSSSRRSSTCSSIDFNPVPGSNGLLNCNRLSLCSLPDDDNEGNDDFEHFEVAEAPELSHEEGAIQEQPLSLKSNENLSDESSNAEDVPVKLGKMEEDAKCEKKMEVSDDKNGYDNKQDEGVEMKSLEMGGDKVEGGSMPVPVVQAEQKSKMGTYSPAKANGFGHQRRLSVSKIELDCGSTKSPDEMMASSAPTSSILQNDKCNSTARKATFPELFVNINASSSSTLPRKLISGSGNELNKVLPTTTSTLGGREKPMNGLPVRKTNSNPFISSSNIQGTQSQDGKCETVTGRNKASFTNDFLQTLGEIYASKSKLISSKNQGSSASSSSTPASSPPTKAPSPVVTPGKIVAVGGKSSKSRDSSIDTAEFECQDRSISEYNISPRSAREVVTESMLIRRDGSSLSSSSLSPKRIEEIETGSQENLIVTEKSVTIMTIPIPPPPFTPGLEMLRNEKVVATKANGNVDPNLPPLTQSKSVANNNINNSGTYKKKPTFIRGTVTNGGGSLPSAEIFDASSPTSPTQASFSSALSSSPCPSIPEKDGTVKILVKHSSSSAILPQVLNEELPKFPTPPPMPPLQYCQSSSASSSALSSMGDSSEISQNSDKSKSSSSSASLWPGSKNVSKSSGNGSSECSLVELTAVNPKSTSDAIIVELKKAQAKKLRSAELQSIISVIPDVQHHHNNGNISSGEDHRTILPILDRPTRGLDSQSKLCGSDVSVFSDGSCSGTAKLVEDPLVQTIVNGKHTNSIIVSDSPVELVNNNTVKRNGVNTSKHLPAHLRGNIMSPSLSGNYTEMNGIDSETMGASSNHEDELSCQLQKENHINEIHGNLEEVQTSNKLDGASFRRVLNEYEKTLSMFIQQIDQLKSQMEETETEKQTIIRERDQASEDLRNVESAFSDVHRKYERAKALLENMKSNEDTLVRRDQEMMQRIENRDKKIDMIKEKAQESIEKMHLDYETRIKEMEFDNAKLRAQFRKMEMKLSTLENDVEQKAKENAQLSTLCDELINGQVGRV